MKRPQKEASVLKVRDIADALDLSVGRIYQMAAEGQVPLTRIGGRLVCPRPAWDAWMASKSAAASASVDGNE